MDATTNLKFTLSSGSTPDNPDNPVNPVTPVTPSTVTPTSPNTGDNTAEGNIGGTVFGALFIVIGFAALIVFLAKYLKKNRRISLGERGSFHLSMRPRIFATVSLSLAIALLGGLAITKFASIGTTEAATIELKVNAATDITFTVDRGNIQTKTDTITVENNGYPYDLYMYTDNNRFALTTNSSVYLTSVTGNILSSTNLSDMSGASTWGVSLLGDDETSSIWAAAPVGSNTSAKIASNKTDSTTTVYYAVNAGTDLPDGTYTAKVSYHAVAQVDGIYNVKTINGYVGPDGVDDDEDFPDGVDVIIRPNCAANQTFSGWLVEKSSLMASDIKPVSGSTNRYHFTMPAEDVVVSAKCSSEEGEKWVIRYNANPPSGQTATGTMDDSESTVETTILRSNTFAITGYTFKGWACASGSPTDATKIKFSDGASVTQADLQSNGCNPQEVPSEDEDVLMNRYNLYAIWQKNIPEPEWIQDVSAEYCDQMELFAVKVLPDRRVDASGATKLTDAGYSYVTINGADHIQYSFTKYADGRCWMLQDLAYQPGTGSVSLTTEDTDVSENRSVTFATSGTNAAYHVPGNNYSTYSVLYNYKAATANTYTTSTAANTTLSDSLCPANWKMPDAQNVNTRVFGDQSGELYDMHHYNIGAANGGGSGKGNAWEKDTFLFAQNITLTAGSASGTSVRAPYFKYSGAWDFVNGRYATNSGADSPNPGAYASYFMSTVRSGSKVAAMNPHKTGSDTNILNGETDPGDGSSLRCVLRTAMQREAGNRNAPVAYGDITE